MSRNPIDIVPNSRIDTIVVDAATGLQRRRTEYTGTAWFGGRASLSGITVSQLAQVQSPFFLPDSLPYRPDPLNDAQVVATVAVQGAEDGSHQLVEVHAGLVADPRNAAVCWIQVQVRARSVVPLGVAYRIDVLVAMNGILAEGS